MNHPYRFLLLCGAIAAASAVQVGCASLSYDQVPGPKFEDRQVFGSSAKRTCDALPEAAASSQLKIDLLTPLAAGCAADLRQEAPWWMPGDDGVRLRLRVVPSQADLSKSSVELDVKRAAAGQVWIDRNGNPFLKRLSDVARTGS